MVQLGFVISNSHPKIACPNCHMQCPELRVPEGRVPNPEFRVSGFGTRGSGQIKIQHNPTHQSANTKQHCMKNMNMIGIRKSHVPTATYNVPSSESRTTESRGPNSGFRVSGLGARGSGLMTREDKTTPHKTQKETLNTNI
jgi:hypothetical protein